MDSTVIKNTEINEDELKTKKKKCKRITILAYVLLAVVLLAVAPVACPVVIKYHTYPVSSDTTGLISKYGSVVYARQLDGESYADGNIVATTAVEGKRNVVVSYVDSNDTASQTLTLRSGDTVNYDQVVGKVRAKTPFIGYLCGLCFSVVGIIILIVLFVIGLVLMMRGNKLGKEIKEIEKENENK